MILLVFKKYKKIKKKIKFTKIKKLRDQVEKPSNILPINTGFLNTFKGGSFGNFREREHKTEILIA